MIDGSVAGLSGGAYVRKYRVQRAVRRVQIQRNVRVVIVHQLDDRPAFGGIELHVIAIEVEALRVRPLTLTAHRAVLRPAVVQREPFIAVGVVDRSHEQHHGLQPVSVLAQSQFAEEDLGVLLSLDFSRVDVALNVDPQLASAPDCLGRGIGSPHHDERKIPLLVSLAEGGDVNGRRGLPEGCEECRDVGVSAGLSIVGLLGNRLERRDVRRGRLSGETRSHEYTQQGGQHLLHAISKSGKGDTHLFAVACDFAKR